MLFIIFKSTSMLLRGVARNKVHLQLRMPMSRDLYVTHNPSHGFRVTFRKRDNYEDVVIAWTFVLLCNYSFRCKSFRKSESRKLSAGRIGDR